MTQPSSHHPASNRREFVRNAARYGLLTAMALLGARITTRQTKPGETCVNRGICSGCGQFAGCGLPQALSAKSAKGGPA